MTEAQVKELEATLSNIYHKNISLLKNEYPHIYKKIIDSENSQNNKYTLDFVNNHFELFDEEGTPTYNCDPFFDAQSRVKNINNSSAFSIIKKDEKYETLHNNYEIEAMNLINDYIEIINQKDVSSTNKFIFLGTILGAHINDINREIKAKSYLIIEDNIEIFRLSMFITDYTELVQISKVFFSIKENSTQKEKTISSFLNYLPEYNHQIKFDLASEKEIYLIEEVSKTLISKNKINYPYSEYLLSLTRGIKYYKRFKRLLNTNKQQNAFGNQNILFIGGGFSLKESIDFVKENKKYFLIVCVGAALKVLAEEEIIPDIIITSDSSDIIKTQFSMENKYYKDSLIFLSNKTNENIVSIFNPKNIFFFNDALEIFPNTGINTGVNVGNVGYSLLLKLGAKNIYLLGFDACVNKKGNTHSNKTINIKLNKFDIHTDDKISSETIFIEVEGNFHKTVTTTMHYKNMIDSFSLLENFSQVNTYNLSRNGALLPGIKPLKIENIKLNFKEEINLQSIVKNLISISKDSLSKNEEDELKTNKKIVKNFENINSQNLYNEFKVISNKYPNNLMVKILDDYFYLINPYYNYSSQVNTKIANDIYTNHWIKIVKFLKENT